MRVRLLAASILLLAGTAAFAAKPDAKTAANGRPVTTSEIQGTWAFDLEASLAHVQATMGVPPEKLRPSLEKYQKTTYAFSGNAIEVRGSPVGDSKGTFRIDGRDLVISNGQREERVQVGLKGKDLVISMMGVGSVYRKK